MNSGKRLSRWSTLGVLVLSLGILVWLTSKRSEDLLPAAVLRFLRSDAKAVTVNKVQMEVQVHPEVLNLQAAFAQVAEKIKPSVVHISTVRIEEGVHPGFEFYFGDPFEELFPELFGRSPQHRQPRKYKRRYEGGGSGVIIDPEGYILTNDHVVRGATEINVHISAEQERLLKGKVVGRDERTDLAVIKVESKKPFIAVQLGDSDSVKVGDWAIAIGSPFGLEQTVTVGVISANRQSLTIEGRVYRNLFQTDAAINRGNSGGPLVNIHGEIIGINTAIYTPNLGFVGIGFAIPINKAKAIIPQLKEKGKVVRSWLGVEIKKVDEAIAKQFKLPDKEGALINKVIKKSPAEKAGLKRGDVIRAVNKEQIKDVIHLQDMITSFPPETKLKIAFVRNGKAEKVDLITSEMPSQGGEEESQEKVEEESKGTAQWKGMSVHSYSQAIRGRHQIPDDVSGVIVVDVEANSPAERIGVLPGDVILAINRHQTPDIDSFTKATEKVELSDGIVLDINRRGNPLYLSYTESE